MNSKAWRLGLVMTLLTSGAAALMFRVGYLQVVKHDEYRQQAQKEHWSTKQILAHRGTIRDRHGYPLAMTVTVFDLYLDRSALVDGMRLSSVAQTLAPLINLPPDKIRSTVAKASENAVLLKADLPYQVGLQIAELRLPGIQTQKEVKRVYPEGNLAATLIGFVGRDQKGLTGIEADFDRELYGLAGTLLFERDSMGNPIPLSYQRLTPPQDGADLVLTIDRFAQRLAESKLDEAMAKHQARSGTIIIMEPHTGAILAMASRPSFDLTKLDLRHQPSMELYRNRAITDTYEPGSVFKVITMAAALNEKLIAPDTTFMDNGVVVKYGWPIYNWNGRANGLSTMTQVLMRSANVGAVWVSDRLGPDRFYKYVQRFGFSQPTNVGLSGDAPGLVRTNKDVGWSPIDVATNSFGQGISVTPLQLATAISAVANGGNLMRPYLVKEVRGPQEKRTFAPVTVRRLLAPETAKMLSEMMNASAERGESKLAIVPSYHVAGKTGTSSFTRDGAYASDSTIASFIGFAPYENPRFLVLVKIDEPKDEPWGSLVASPVFSAITKELLAYLRIPPTELPMVQNRGDR